MLITGCILALDLATATGFAIGDPGGDPQFETFRLPSTGEDVGAFGLAFEAWLIPLIGNAKPQVVAYERPSVFSKTTPATMIKLNGLAYDTEKICKRLRVPVFAINPSQLKKFFTGRGNAKKPEMMEVARRYGWRVRDDNQADACAAWAWMVWCYAPKEHRARFAGGPLTAAPLIAEAAA